MKVSNQEIEKLLTNYEFEEVIKKLKDVVITQNAGFDDYVYFIEAVTSFVDTNNYPLAYDCFIKANMCKRINEHKLQKLYGKIVPVVKKLGFSYFNDKNTFGINLYFYHYARFILNISSSKHRDALQSISKMIEISPSAANYLQRSKLYSQQKQFKMALSDLDKGISLNQNNHNLFYQRAIIKQKLKDFNGAYNDFDTAINLNPDNHKYYYSRGLLQEEEKRFKNALDDFKMVIRLDSKNVNALIEIAWCNYKLENYRDALSFSNLAVDMDTNNAGSYYVRGTIKNNIKIFQEAADDLTKAIKLDNCSDKLWTSKIWYQKAWADFKLENHKAAEKDILEAIKYSNRSVPYYLLAMDIEYFGLKNYLNAKNYCQEVLRLDPNNSRALTARKHITESIQDM